MSLKIMNRTRDKGQPCRRLVGLTPMNPQAPSGAYRAGPVLYDKDKIHTVPPDFIAYLRHTLDNAVHSLISVQSTSLY